MLTYLIKLYLCVSLFRCTSNKCISVFLLGVVCVLSPGSHLYMFSLSITPLFSEGNSTPTSISTLLLKSHQHKTTHFLFIKLFLIHTLKKNIIISLQCVVVSGETLGEIIEGMYKDSRLPTVAGGRLTKNHKQYK